MERITTTIPQAEVDRQLQYCREIARMNADRGGNDQTNLFPN